MAVWATSLMVVALALLAAWDIVATWGTLSPAEMGTDLYYVAVALILVPSAMALRAGRQWGRAVIVTAHVLLVLSMIALAGFLGWLVVLPVTLSGTVLLLLATPSARRWVAAHSPRRVLFDDE